MIKLCPNRAYAGERGSKAGGQSMKQGIISKMKEQVQRAMKTTQGRLHSVSMLLENFLEEEKAKRKSEKEQTKARQREERKQRQE